MRLLWMWSPWLALGAGAVAASVYAWRRRPGTSQVDDVELARQAALDSNLRRYDWFMAPQFRSPREQHPEHESW